MVRNACWSVLVTPRGRTGQGLVSSTVLALGPQPSRTDVLGRCQQWEKPLGQERGHGTLILRATLRIKAEKSSFLHPGRQERGALYGGCRHGHRGQ